MNQEYLYHGMEEVNSKFLETVSLFLGFVLTFPSASCYVS